MIIIEILDFIKELKNMKLIAHRLGYQMTPYPENSIEVLKYIFERQELLDACYGFEFDICFTKDHIPVVIHDKYIDDISDSYGLINNYTIDELKNFNFKFRKSLKISTDFTSFNIVTLEEILSFFDSNKALLKDKIIKVETKDYIFSNKNNLNTKNLKIFAEIVNKFPRLSQNIVHLSFWPLNLFFFRKIEKKNGYKFIKNDLLCDFSIVVFLSRFMPYLDNISLRIKTKYLPKKDKNNSKRVNRKIGLDLFFMNITNALKEKNLRYALTKYNSVGMYTLNDYDEIAEVCKNISENIFKENTDKIIITTNNPIYIKKFHEK